MKTTLRFSVLFLISAFLLLPGAVHAQVSVGVQGGVAISDLVGDDVEDDEFDSRNGALAGAFVGFPLADRIGLSTGLYFVQKGGDGTALTDQTDVRADYLEIPLLLQLGVLGNEDTGLSLFAGPSVSFELKCELENDLGTFDCDDQDLGPNATETKSTLLGGLVGLGVRHALSERMFVNLNGGVNFGLTSVDDSTPEEDFKHRSWFALIGIGWTLGDFDGGM